MQKQLGEDPNKIGEAHLNLMGLAETGLYRIYDMELLASDTCFSPCHALSGIWIVTFSCVGRQEQWLVAILWAASLWVEGHAEGVLTLSYPL